VTINGENCDTGAKCCSKLHLIDLAGSERLSRSGVVGEQAREAQNINKSLSALGDVMTALHNKSKHVPFRNSKLTFLLQGELSGQSKVLMLTQASPDASDLDESLSTLRFAERVRATSVGVAKKNSEAGDYAQCRQQLGAAQKELRAKTCQLEALQKQAKVADQSSQSEQERAQKSKSERERAKQHSEKLQEVQAKLQRELQQAAEEKKKVAVSAAETEAALTKAVAEKEAAESNMVACVADKENAQAELKACLVEKQALETQLTAAAAREAARTKEAVRAPARRRSSFGVDLPTNQHASSPLSINQLVDEVECSRVNKETGAECPSPTKTSAQKARRQSRVAELSRPKAIRPKTRAAEGVKAPVTTAPAKRATALGASTVPAKRATALGSSKRGLASSRGVATTTGKKTPPTMRF